MSKYTVVLFISAAFLINIVAIAAIQNTNELNEQKNSIEEPNDKLKKDSIKNPPPHDTDTTQPGSVKNQDKEVCIFAKSHFKC